MLLISGTKLFGQSSATASVSATIITPVGAKKSADLNFGNFATGSQPGTIELNSSGIRISFGGVKLLETNGNADIASFIVMGSNSEYAVTLPSTSIILLRKGGTETMTVGSFRITASAKDYLNASTQTFSIGATLNAGISQPTGDYVPPMPLTVIVNYN
ncbi:MAG TPA: DUF4402 domain-containing protein [Chitinophagaceae bacterium]|nr:DUF4402 domain-containing protein [Chitinophagaceae bacterium]